MYTLLKIAGKSYRQDADGQWFIWTNEGTLLNCWDWKKIPALFNGLKVGQPVTTSGFAGTVVRLCEWSTSMVEVRLASGVCCVDAGDVKPIQPPDHTAASFVTVAIDDSDGEEVPDVFEVFPVAIFDRKVRLEVRRSPDDLLPGIYEIEMRGNIPVLLCRANLGEAR